MGREMEKGYFDRISVAMIESVNEWTIYENDERARCGKKHGFYKELRYDVSEC